MLSHFPQVRNEESTYSIFSRLQFNLQPPSLQVMGTILFNKNEEVGRLNFQSSFDYLCNNLPSKFTSENFFNNNTIYPLFIPFISTEKQEKALEYFKGDYPDKVNRYLPIKNITKNRKYIRICKECIEEDFNIYGEPYYRRQHEIELNRICYKHKVPLYEYAIFPYIIPRRYDNYYTVLSGSKVITIPKEFRGKFLDITEDINTIFSSNLDNWNIEITKNKISNRIAEKGYLTINGLKLQHKFCQDFKKHYSEEFLDYIGYNFDVNSQHDWVRKVTKNEPEGDPLKFILVIRYLFGSFKEFYQYNKEYSTFKQGPYPCLNKVCPNYNKLVIKDTMKVTISQGFPVATFECEHCGFKYSRKGPDKNANDIYNKTYVKDRGHLWHDKLKECVANGLTIKKMCEILDCNSCERLLIHINKFKNPNLIETHAVKFKNKPDNLSLDRYKNEVLSLIKENPNATRVAIYRLNPKAYNYLLNNDNKWISTIRPVKKSETISQKQQIKNYWLNKDDLLVTELLKAISKIKSESPLYKRLSINTLENYIGYQNLNRNRTKLPKCFEILDKVCETNFTYQKRKINYVMREMKNNGVNITIKKVLRNVYLDFRESRNQEILEYVQEMVNEYNRGNVNIIENSDKYK